MADEPAPPPRPAEPAGDAPAGWAPRPPRPRLEEVPTPVRQWAEALHAHVRRPVVSAGLVAVNVAVWGLMAAQGVDPRQPSSEDLVAWGANTWPRSLGDEPWRLLTSGFLHIGLVHLVVNMLSLWALRLVEQVVGRAGHLVVFLGAIVGGGLLSAARGAPTVSAGASGGVFGLFGAALAIAVLPSRRSGVPDAVRRSLRAGMLQNLALNVVIAATVPRLDHAAHAGGLVAGFLLALPLVRAPTPEHVAARPRRALATASVAAQAFVLAAFGARAVAERRADPDAAHEAAPTDGTAPAAAELQLAAATVRAALEALRGGGPLPADLDARLDAADAALRRAARVSGPDPAVDAERDRLAGHLDDVRRLLRLRRARDDAGR